MDNQTLKGVRMKTADYIDNFASLAKQTPTKYNFISRWVVEKLTKRVDIHTSQRGWIDSFYQSFLKNTEHPTDYLTMNIAVYRPERLEGVPSIRISLERPIQDLMDIRDKLMSRLPTKIKYSPEQIREIFDHEIDHFEKAEELGIDLSQSTLSIIMYKGWLDEDIEFTLTLGSKELPVLDDMEICLAPAKPSESDYFRFIHLLTNLDINVVGDIDRLYSIIKLYCEKAQKPFTTDIHQLYMDFRGIRLLDEKELQGLAVDSKVDIDDNSYLFEGIEGENMIVSDEDGIHKVPIKGTKVYVDK